MGVSGCGKSTISNALAEQTGWCMLEGDDYHPDANIQKMAEGIPLNDSDRKAWLEAIIKAIELQDISPIILACSALTPYVQNALRSVKGRSCVWVLLDGPKGVIKHRLETRAGHFMKAELLDSQLAALTVPDDAIAVSIDGPIAAIAENILSVIALD